MATATFGPQGKTRAVDSIRVGAVAPRVLRMNTFHAGSTTPDPVMDRTITWTTHADYVRSTNELPVKTATANSEYEGALLFPIAASRKFSNMTLHSDNLNFPLLLTFVLEGAESSIVSNYGGAAKLVGAITISF
jgi:hypothetical protein